MATVTPQLEAELTEQLAQKNLKEQAKGILKQLLAGQRPGIQDLVAGCEGSIRKEATRSMGFHGPWRDVATTVVS